MKKQIFLLAVLLLATALIPSVSAQTRIASVDYIRISDAYYADLDGDGVEDDIKILVEFAFTILEPSRVDLNLWIELPSGYTYNVRVFVYRAPSESILNIDCFNMATESGWYTVTMLATITGISNGKLYITDQLIFDPPTEAGPGLPGVTAYF